MSMEYNTSGFRMRWIPIVFGLIAAGVVCWQGCERGMFGERHVFALTPQQEDELGARSYNQFLGENRGAVITRGPAVDRVNEIGRRLAMAAESEEVLKVLKIKPRPFKWEFRLVNSNQVNAFCMPGGKVVVYTGLLPVAQTDAGLACVMGHEIGHALARHGSQRMAQQKLSEIGQMTVSQAMEDPRYRDGALKAFNLGSQYGFLLPYSRKHESEADHIGILLMAKAGYNPQASVGFWERMGKLGGKQPSEFQSTHPSHEHRAHDLQGWMAEAEQLYQHSQHQDSQQRLPLR